MEQNIQPNIDNSLGIFSQHMSEAFDKIKKSMTQELTSQMNKNTYMCKLNRAGEPLYPDKGVTLDAIYDRLLYQFGLRDTTDRHQGIAKYELYVDNKNIKFNVPMCLRTHIKKNLTFMQFEADEYIVNYKYQYTTDSQHFVFIFIITNRGSMIINFLGLNETNDMNTQPHYNSSEIIRYNFRMDCTNLLNLAYRGKFKLPNDILYIFNEMINAMLPSIPRSEYDYQTIYAVTSRQNPQAGNNTQVEARYLQKYAAIITLMETYQNNYVKPLIEYNAQRIIDETAELNIKRYELNRIKVEQEMARIKLIDKEKQIAKDLELYSNIQNLEAKFDEIKKYKDSLDLYAKQLDADRKQLFEDKIELERRRDAMKSDRVSESVYGGADVVLDDGGAE